MPQLLTRSLMLIVFMHVMIFGMQNYLVDTNQGSFSGFDENSVLGKFILFNADKTPQGVGAVGATLPTSPTKSSITAGGNDFILIDYVELLFGFIVFILQLIAAPLTIWMVVPGMPAFIALVLGVPIFIAFVLGWVYTIRGLSE